MHKPLLLIPFVLGLAACATPGPAQREVISRQLAGDLAGGQVFLDIPAGFPEFDMPAGVTVEGSLDRNFGILVILRSELPTEELTAAVKAAFLPGGWIELDPFPFQQQRTGFITDLPPNFPGAPSNQLCHDRFGTLSYSPRGQQGIYNRLGLDWNRTSAGPGQLSCEQQNLQRQGQQARFNPLRMGLQQYLPVLELPQEDRGSRFQPFFGGGTSADGNSVSTSAPLELDWDLADISDWFAGQLREQGWQEDASWEGSETGGSTWTRTTEDGTALSGLLDILHVEENSWQLRFRLAVRGRMPAIGIRAF